VFHRSHLSQRWIGDYLHDKGLVLGNRLRVVQDSASNLTPVSKTFCVKVEVGIRGITLRVHLLNSADPFLSWCLKSFGVVAWK